MTLTPKGIEEFNHGQAYKPVEIPPPPPPKGQRVNVFKEADAIIYGDREETYGHPAKNLEHISQQWSLYIFQKFGVNIDLEAEDVAWMMADLKKCRQINKHKRDNIVDAIGYIGLVQRVAEHKEEQGHD